MFAVFILGFKTHKYYQNRIVHQTLKMYFESCLIGKKIDEKEYIPFFVLLQFTKQIYRHFRLLVNIFPL